MPKEKRKQRGYPEREFPGRVARFIGFAEGTAAYLLWDGATCKTVISGDVKFFETQLSFSYQDFEADSDADYAWIFIPDGEEHVNAESAEHQTNLPAQETSQTTTLTSLTDIFATVVRTENFRMLLTLIAIHGWEYVISDVKNAFPNTVLQKPAYIKIPHGIKGDRKQECWKLLKALYGLRRSPAEWNKLLYEVLLSLRFKKAKSDWNFYYIIEGGKRSYCIFHLDDGIITSNDKSVLAQIIKKLQERFELKINTNPDKFLGIKIKRDKESKIIGLVQEDYIIQCAEKFKITDMRNFSTSLEPGFVDSVSYTDIALETNTPYRSLIGALLFIARMTRPDVLFAVSVRSKHLTKLQIKHWNAAKRVLAYHYQTRHECLLLGHMKDASDELTLRC